MGNRHARYTSDSSMEDSYNPFRDDYDDDYHEARSPPKPEIKRWTRNPLLYKKDEREENGVEIHEPGFSQSDNIVKIKYCDWSIPDFPSSDIVKKENVSIRSEVYLTGSENQFQYFFVMDKIKNKEGVFYGVYINVLSNIRSEATYKIKSYLRNYRSHKVQLSSSRNTKFPRKNGFKFLGSIAKTAIYEEDPWEPEGYFSERYVPDGELSLVFKLEVFYKSKIDNSLRSLVEKNKAKNVTLAIGNIEFKANEKIIQERCPKLAAMINKKKKAKSPITGVDPYIMEQIMQYIYTNRVTKLFTHGKELENAAKKFGLKELQYLCKKAVACSAVYYLKN